jgi:aromatic ring hydroxylase
MGPPRGYLETLRAFIQAAEASPVCSPSGLALPNPTMALAARTFAIERYPHVLQSIRELCGPGLLMVPGQADLHNPEIGPHLHRYFVAQDEGAPERFRLLKLAWEYACDSYGSRQLLFEMYNVGSLATNKHRLASVYDTSPYIALARELAGITGPAGQSGVQAASACPGMPPPSAAASASV